MTTCQSFFPTLTRNTRNISKMIGLKDALNYAVSALMLTVLSADGAIIKIDGNNGIATLDGGTLVINTNVTLSADNEYIPHRCDLR